MVNICPNCERGTLFTPLPPKLDFLQCDQCLHKEYLNKKTKPNFPSDKAPNEEPTCKPIKPRPELIPPEAIHALAYVLAQGAEKHGARSWEKGMDWSENYGALQRHLLAWYSGETYDNGPGGTGKSHLWNACTRLAFLIGSEARGIGTDDRPLCNKPKKDKETSS